MDKMDFGYDKEQEMLRKSFAEFLSKESPFDTIREIKKSEAGYAKELWKKMAQLGWLGLIFAEKYGGSQGTFTDLFLLFEEIGKVQLPSPLLMGNVLPGLIIQSAATDAVKEKYLPAMINGKKIVVLALYDEKGCMDSDRPKISATKEADGYVVNGTRLLVPYANAADEILVCAQVEGDSENGPTLFAVDAKAKGIRTTSMNIITDEKSHVVVFDNVRVGAGNIIGKIGKGNAIINEVMPKAVVLKCAEMIGGLRRLLDMTVNYAKDRRQFGRPIGSFQAVQHFCADMAIFLDGGALIAGYAASLISDGAPCEKEVSMAKAFISDAYKQSTWMSQQIHGGIGFTEEFNIQLFYKHAKESELMFGHSAVHRSRVADLIGL
jgi:3-oxocholest-4-en-26-oyl-CoA dehydrogenase beta subunit